VRAVIEAEGLRKSYGKLPATRLVPDDGRATMAGLDAARDPLPVWRDRRA